MSSIQLQIKDKTNVINPLSISLILGGIFIILNIFILLAFNRDNTLYNLFTCFIAVFAVLYSFIFGIIYVLVINGKNMISALKIIAIIVSITVGITAFFMGFNLTGKYVLINAFENSIGYFICSAFFKQKIDKMFQFKENVFNDDKTFQPNKSVLLTLFTLENFEGLYDLLKNEDNNEFNFYITGQSVDGDGEESLKNVFKKIVSYKNIIGILGWFYITAFFTTIVSIKYLINI